MFGAMFAPRPERVAAELIRACERGGLIAMANWTPEGFVGKSFRVNAEMVPPPAGLPAPALWGNEQVIQQRLSSGVSKLSLTRQRAVFDYPFSPKEVVEFFRQYFGPTQATFSRLDKQGQSELAARLESLWLSTILQPMAERESKPSIWMLERFAPKPLLSTLTPAVPA
jgi:hypothetical protein